MPGQSRKLLPSCFSFPQGLERWLAVLPRPWLDRFELHAFPRFFSDSEFLDVLGFWQGRRVAFVRQSTCLITYRAEPCLSWQDRALTAKHHPGPFSLLAELGADFFVVRQAKDPETFAWRGKHLGDPDPEKTFQKMEAYRLREESLPGVVSCEEVRWEDYDLVICLDVPVPARITRRARHTFWTYLSVEAGGPLQETSLKRPVDGYHCFLNHSFRKYRTRPGNRSRILEFPYAFQSSSAWKLLLKHLGLENAERAGVLIDQASAKEVPKGERPDMQVMGGEPRVGLSVCNMISLYAKRKYAVRTAKFKRWGNWPVEVVQAGCLFLGRSSSLDMKSCVLPGLDVPDLGSARRKIDELEKNPELFEAYRNLQATITEHVAFRRPLADLTAHARRFFESR